MDTILQLWGIAETVAFGFVAVAFGVAVVSETVHGYRDRRDLDSRPSGERVQRSAA